MSSSPSDQFLSMTHFLGKAIKRMDGNLSLHGISYTEYRVLHQLSLAAGETLPRIELARSVGLTASGVTRLIAPMEKMGLVEKQSHPRDARMSLVKLSAAGGTIHDDASKTVEHVASAFTDSLSKSQQQALERLFAGGE